MDAVKTLGKTLVASPERQVEADSDMDIVRRVQGGEVGSFDQLVLKYRGRVYSVVYNLTSNREDASDLTQEAFIKAFQSINRFQGQSSFFTWLYRIAVNSTRLTCERTGCGRFSASRKWARTTRFRRKSLRP